MKPKIMAKICLQFHKYIIQKICQEKTLDIFFFVLYTMSSKAT